MKTALILGANSEIAFEFSKLLAKKNYTLFLASRNLIKLRHKKNYLKSKFKIKCKTFKFDLDKYIYNKNFFTKIKNIDLVFIAAGYLDKENLEVNRTLNVNYIGQKKFILDILKRKYKYLSKIICITSVSGDRIDSNNNNYSLSKKKMSKFLIKINKKFEKKKIILKDIKPGYVKTKLIKDKYISYLLGSDPFFVAQIIFNSMSNDNKVIYIPSYWKLLVSIYNKFRSVLDIFFPLKKSL